MEQRQLNSSLNLAKTTAHDHYLKHGKKDMRIYFSRSPNKLLEK